MASVSISYFDSVLDYACRQGADRTELLTQIGLPNFDASDEHLRISLAHYAAALQAASISLDDPLFGLHLGQDIRAADYGVLGYLVESSVDLASAIEALLKYDTLVADIGTAKLEQHTNSACLSWQPTQPCNEQVPLRNMVAWVAMVKHLVSGPLTPDAVHFQHLYPKPLQQHLQDWFACEVKVGQTTNSLWFPLAYLNQAFRGGNKANYQALSLLSQQQLAQIQSLNASVHNVQHMLQSIESLAGVNLVNVALALSISPRGLQRRLKAEGLSFRHILDAERQRRCQLLISQLPMGQLAFQLGFEEQSSLNRAFKRWYGCSPSAFIKRNT